MTARDRLRLRIWTAACVGLAVLGLARLGHAQTLRIMGNPTSTIPYQFFAVLPFAATVNAPSAAATEISPLPDVPVGMDLLFSGAPLAVTPSTACGGGCEEEVLTGSSGSFTVTAGSSTAESGTFGNVANETSAIFANPTVGLPSTAVIQLAFTSNSGPSSGTPGYLILSGATTVGPLCTPVADVCNSNPAMPGPQYLNNFTLGGTASTEWTATVSATPYGNRQVYLNSANIGSSSVSWSSPTNPWLLGSTTSTITATPPQAGDDVFVVNTTASSGSTTVNFDAITDPQLSSLTIDSVGGATGAQVTLSQSNLPTINGMRPNLILTSANETIGGNGPATYQQSGTGSSNNVTETLTINQFGTYDLQGSPFSETFLIANTIQVKSGGTFKFDGGSIGFAAFDLSSGGTVTAAGDEVLDSDFSPSGGYLFEQTGGSNTVTGTLWLGQNAPGGVYQLQGGTVVAAGEKIIDESFVQTGINGTSNTVNGDLQLEGAYILAAGSLGSRVQNSLTAQNEIIYGPGQFTQGAHTLNTVSGTLTLGAFGLGGGLYAFQGGVLTANAIQVNAGGTFTEILGVDNFGTPQNTNVTANSIQVNPGGTFTQTGGTLNYGTFTLNGMTSGFTSTDTPASVTSVGNVGVGSEFITGNEYIGTTFNPSPTSSFIQNGSFAPNSTLPSSIHTVDGALVLGLDANTTGNYTLNGGRLSAAVEEVGFLGTGVFTQLGGDNSITPSGGPTTPGGSTVQTITSSNGLVTVNELNGTLTIGSQPGSAGRYEMAAGTLEAANINVNAGGTFDIGGKATVGQQMNNAGNVSINSTNGVLTVQTYTQTGGSITFNDNGTLIALGGGNSIQIDGGTAGGFGTIETSCGNSFCSKAGTVTVNNATLQVGASPDPLTIHANFTQTGGKIIFEIDPDGMGGFLESTLVFDKGADLSISDADIVLDFLNGADAAKFFGDGLLKIDTFFNVGNGDPFGMDFNLASIFTDDSFSTNLAGESITNFDPETGALTLAATGNVPEPDSLLLLLSGLAAAAPIAGWQRRRVRRTALRGST